MTDALIHLRASAWAGMTPAEFRAWQAHMGLTVRAAAELLDAGMQTRVDAGSAGLRAGFAASSRWAGVEGAAQVTALRAGCVR